MNHVGGVLVAAAVLTGILEVNCIKIRGQAVEIPTRNGETTSSIFRETENRNPDNSGCTCEWSDILSGLIFPANYSRLEIPIPKTMKNGKNENENIEAAKLSIWVGVLIRKIREVDEIEEEVTVELDFVISWMDRILFEANKGIFEELGNITENTLAESFKTLDYEFLRRIWKPDLFIEHVVSIIRPDLISQPIKLNFSPIGAIIYSTRVTIKMDCDMEFHFYPADTQHCTFKIRSYSHTVKELNLAWMSPKSVFVFDRSDTNFDIKVSQVEVLNRTEFEDLLYPNYSETYNILQFTLSARRRLSFHLIQTYIPTVFFIGITWLCFLIPPAMVEIRIGIAMTTLLTLTSMFSAVRESTPVSSYPKAIDVWIVVCVFFIFVTLLEFALLVWLRYQQIDLECPNELITLNESYSKIPTGESDENEERRLSFTKKLRLRHRQRDERWRNKRFQNAAIIIEEYAFATFFLSFVFFNIMYWPWLLVASDYFNWSVDPEYNVDD